MLGQPLRANDKQAGIQAVDTRGQSACHVHTHTAILLYTCWMAANTHSIVQPLRGNAKQTWCFVDWVLNSSKNNPNPLLTTCQNHSPWLMSSMARRMPRSKARASAGLWKVSPNFLSLILQWWKMGLTLLYTRSFCRTHSSTTWQHTEFEGETK